MLMAADAASQGLVIGVASAIVAVLGLLMAAIYKMLGDAREDIRTLRQTTESGFEKLRGEFNGINREVGELKVRLEYVGTAAAEAQRVSASAPRGEAARVYPTSNG